MVHASRMEMAKLDIGDGSIAIEVTPTPGQQRAGLSDGIHARWEDAQPAIQKIAHSFHESLVALGDRAPATSELTFGLKVSAEAGWVVAKTQGELSFQIKMTWSR